MQSDSIPFQIWKRNIKVAGYVAVCALLSCVLCIRLTRYTAAIVIGSIVCGLISFVLSAVQIRTKRYFGFLHTIFSVFAMLIVTHQLAPAEHQRAAIWQFVSLYILMWFGLVFLFRQMLLHRLEVTNAA